jgi:hypothetical protein
VQQGDDVSSLFNMRKHSSDEECDEKVEEFVSSHAASDSVQQGEESSCIAEGGGAQQDEEVNGRATEVQGAQGCQLRQLQRDSLKTGYQECLTESIKTVQQSASVGNVNHALADMLECPLCFDEIRDDFLACRTVCNHVFCKECLTKTFESHPPSTHGRCPICRTTVSVFTTACLKNEEKLRKPDVSTISGCIYVQGLTIGLASYHFVSETECYICYTAAPDEWLLDDGSRPPAQKPFTETSYDSVTRTFRGNIDWSPTSFDNEQSWEYEMVFSDNFDIISGGKISAFLPDGSLRHESRYPHDLRYCRVKLPPATLYGSTFLQFRAVGIASYHFVREDDCYIGYQNAPATWVLADGTRPPAKKSFLDPEYNHITRTFRATVDWTPSTFMGDERWEYHMMFDENLTKIERGQVRRFAPRGEELDPIEFGTHLMYVRLDEVQEHFAFLLR